MQIAVITVKREPMYLYETLDQLCASYIRRRPDVFVGTPDGFDEIAERVFANARPHAIQDDLWKLIEPLPTKLRAVGNFIAALQSSNDDLVIFEDDVAIKPGWLEAVDEAVTWNGDRNAFLSLYSHIDRRRHRDDCHTVYHITKGNVILRPPVRAFYGTLGLYVPKAHRNSLAEAAMAQLSPTNPHPPEIRQQFDQVVTLYINDHPECSMIVTIPSYVNHRGDVSTINPTHGPRRAPMF